MSEDVRSVWRQGIRVGLLLATSVGIYSILVLWLFRPLHAEGFAQPVLGVVNAFDHLLQAPGFRLAVRQGLTRTHHSTMDAWLFSRGVNCFVYFGVGFLLGSIWSWAGKRGIIDPSRLMKSIDEPAANLQPALSRRRFLRHGLGVSAGGITAGLGYAIAVEPRWFEITHRVFPLADLPTELDGLRVAHLTDIHHGPWLSLRYVREVVDAVNAEAPDLVLLTGDYVHQSAKYIDPVADELARLRPGIAALAVLGNHDWWEDGERMRRGLERGGIVVIDHARRVLTPERRLAHEAQAGLVIAGVGDLWEDRPDYRRALGGLSRSLPCVLLSHNPDVAEEPPFRRGGYRVDLMLSGHTHGGQVAIPFLGTPLLPSAYGQKYAQGLVQGPTCPVYVCRGVGVSMMPVRVGVLPEVAMLELKRESLADASG